MSEQALIHARPHAFLPSSPSKILARACACGQKAGTACACHEEEPAQLQRTAAEGWPTSIGYRKSLDLTSVPGRGRSDLTVSQPEDPLEQEADRMAEVVLEDHSPLPMSDGAPRGCQQPTVPPSVHETLARPGHPLDGPSRAFMESSFGQSFDRVRIHTDRQAAESALAVNSLAYTVGHHVVFAPGEYAPSTGSGKRLLAHELAHVAQLRQGSNTDGILHRVVLPPARPESERPAPAHPRSLEETFAPSLVAEREALQYHVSEIGRCMSTRCEAFRPGGAERAACERDPKACGQRWATSVGACLAAAPTGLQARDRILADEAAEVPAEVAAIDRWYDGIELRDQSPRYAATYLDRLFAVCRVKRREIQSEFRYGVVFSGAPLWAYVDPSSAAAHQARPWARAEAEWDEIDAALAAVPASHLRERRRGPGLTFRRENAEAAISSVGAETDTSTNVVTLYDAGTGATPYSRSAAIPEAPSATRQTLRHEIGHVVERWDAPSVLDLAKVIGWEWYYYSSPLSSNPPMPSCPTTGSGPSAPAGTPLLPVTDPATRRRLCTDAGLQAGGGCDEAALNRFLADLRAGSQVANGRCFAPSTSMVNSWPTAAMPGGRAFEYARTSISDYFAEVYSLALSVPEWLHGVLPAPQLDFFKQRIFSTPEALATVLPSIEAYARDPGVAADPRAAELLRRARLQFTRDQLQGILDRLETIWQRSPRPPDAGLGALGGSSPLSGQQVPASVP